MARRAARCTPRPRIYHSREPYLRTPLARLPRRAGRAASPDAEVRLRPPLRPGQQLPALGARQRAHARRVRRWSATPGPLRKRDGGIDVETFKRATESYLHLVPRYRQRLHAIPFFDHSVWVDDPHFDIDYHIRHTALPMPGSSEQLKKLSARIMAQPLDRKRPLWETWIVEGLEGDRFAMITKIHHCMIDGASGVDLAYIQMSPTPEVRELGTPPPFHPRPAPSRFELWRDEVARQLGIPLEIVRDFRQFTADAEDLGQELLTRAKAVVNTLGMGTSADETPINGRVGPHRRFDWLACQRRRSEGGAQGVGLHDQRRRAHDRDRRDPRLSAEPRRGSREDRLPRVVAGLGAQGGRARDDGQQGLVVDHPAADRGRPRRASSSTRSTRSRAS